MESLSPEALDRCDETAPLIEKIAKELAFMFGDQRPWDDWPESVPTKGIAVAGIHDKVTWRFAARQILRAAFTEKD